MKKHLRGIINNHWRPLVLKDRCEECGSNKNLELHHMDSFRIFMNQYSVPEDKKFLSNEEIKYFEYLCLGYHLKEVKVLTLCNECHKNIHKIIGRTGIKNKRKIKFMPKKDRDKILVKIYVNTNLSANIISSLKKKDIKKYNFINKNEIYEYAKDLKDEDYLFISRKGNNKPITRIQAYRIIKEYVTF